jgi:hypothetical protein
MSKSTKEKIMELIDDEREIIQVWKTYFTKTHRKFLASLLLED